MVFALKEDGTLRFCVDYRRLYAFIEPDFYPILGINECVDSLSEAAAFTIIDVDSNYCTSW